MIKGVLTKVQQATAKTGASYCTLTIKTLEPAPNDAVIINVWNSTSDRFKIFHLYEINGEKVNEQGASCTISNITESALTKPYKDLIPLPPDREQWNFLTIKLSQLMEPVESKFFLAQCAKLYTPYSKAPAAKSNHHAFPGGLLLHTYEMLSMYHSLYNSLPFHTNTFIVSISCLFHDYLKLAEYSQDNYDYQPIMFLKGHVIGSAEVLGALLRKESFPEELIMHCQHCCLAHHGIPEWGSSIQPSTPEAFLVHHLDMLSGHGHMFEETPNGTRNNGLGRTIFHYK